MSLLRLANGVASSVVKARAPAAATAFTRMMSSQDDPKFIITASGADRVGIVAELTSLVKAHGGNVETSKMAKLGGDFAILSLVAVPEGSLANLESDLGGMKDMHVRVTRSSEEKKASATPVKFRTVSLIGPDAKGQVFALTNFLREQNLNILSMKTAMEDAPMAGYLQFRADVKVEVPEDFKASQFRTHLNTLGDDLGVELTLESRNRNDFL